MIKIEFHTVNAGWISGEIVLDQKTRYYFTYSWITNFLNDLLKASLSIGEYVDDSTLEKFMTHAEPAIDDWLLSKKGNNLVIYIKRFKDETRKELIENTVIKCTYHEFMKSLIDGLTRMIKKIGLYGYRIEWNEDFPLSLYLKSYDIIYETNLLDVKQLTLDETYGYGGQASNIDNELILLNHILKD